MSEDDDDEPQTATGTIMTRITCPCCGHVWDEEGDAEGDKLDCPDCEAPVVVRRT